MEISPSKNVINAVNLTSKESVKNNDTEKVKTAETDTVVLSKESIEASKKDDDVITPQHGGVYIPPKT
jgi:hypothetical protein